jgi:hypothetical protein
MLEKGKIREIGQEKWWKMGECALFAISSKKKEFLSVIWHFLWKNRYLLCIN